jgi:hypothetical protein
LSGDGAAGFCTVRAGGGGAVFGDCGTTGDHTTVLCTGGLGGSWRSCGQRDCFQPFGGKNCWEIDVNAIYRPRRHPVSGREGIGRMIEERLLIMTVRESVHQIVDTLPDERLDDVLDYLAELSEPDEPLCAETRTAIEEGLEDIRNGRTMALEEYQRTRSL